MPKEPDPGGGSPSMRSSHAAPLLAGGRLRIALAAAWLAVRGQAALEADAPFAAPTGSEADLALLHFRLSQELRRALPAGLFAPTMRPSEMLAALARHLDGFVPPADEGTVFLLADAANPAEWVADFRVACAPALDLRAVEFGHWPYWVTPGFDATALVAAMARRIACAQPDGALRLTGVGQGGGALAFLVAKRLLAIGRPVAFLGLMAPGKVAASTPGTRPVDAAGRWAERLARPGAERWLRGYARVWHWRLPRGFDVRLQDALHTRLLARLMDEAVRTMVSTTALTGVPVVLFAETAGDWARLCPELSLMPGAARPEALAAGLARAARPLQGLAA